LVAISPLHINYTFYLIELYWLLNETGVSIARENVESGFTGSYAWLSVQRATKAGR
jgi:hypothetical protein